VLLPTDTALALETTFAPTYIAVEFTPEIPAVNNPGETFAEEVEFITCTVGVAAIEELPTMTLPLTIFIEATVLLPTTLNPAASTVTLDPTVIAEVDIATAPMLAEVVNTPEGA
jgi:hypothetical protein